MALLTVCGKIRGQGTTLCSFSLSVNGAPFVFPDTVVGDLSNFTVPDQALQFTVRATAVDAAKYPFLEAIYEFDVNGNVIATLAPPEFESPNVLITPFVRTIFLVVHFTPFVDVTEQARQSLSPTGADFPGSPPAQAPGNMSFRAPFFSALPPASYTLPSLNSATFISDPSIGGFKIQVQAASSVPLGEVRILEIPGIDKPRLLAVYWPNAVQRNGGAAQTPFLVYFHPTAGQNAPAFFVDPRDRHDPGSGSTYPWGFDYHFFGFWRYLVYEGDPLKADPFCKGLPYQIDTSGKNVVLVLPLNKVASSPCDEITSFTDAAFLQEHLEELQAWFFRRSDNYQPSGLGRLGMASFSSGHSLLSCFLNKPANQAHHLYLNTLQEIYLFDPHADLASVTLGPTTSMLTWSLSGASLSKVARLYTQNAPGTLGTILSNFGILGGNGPFDAAVPLNPGKSVACLPLASWNALAATIPGSRPYNNTGIVHQVISALMLTDALRKSEF